jgi:hypothetical protein
MPTASSKPAEPWRSWDTYDRIASAFEGRGRPGPGDLTRVRREL